MKVRKIVFAVSVVALTFGSAILAEKTNSERSQRPRIMADGTAPLPPLPRPTREVTSTTVADGTAPLPPLPKRDLQQA